MLEDEMCEWFESIILDLIEEYENKEVKSAEDIGAIKALRKLLKQLED